MSHLYLFPWQSYTSFLTITCIYSSQFEEKFEEINGSEAPLSILPASPVVTECQATTVAPEESRDNATDMQGQETSTICPTENESHDIVNGIMKIVPDVNVSRYFNIFFGRPCPGLITDILHTKLYPC